METYTQTVDEILAETDIVNRCPLPLDVIPNRMGINLCSVESVSWSRQDDGQLTNLTINFTPSKEDVCGVPPGTSTADYVLKTVSECLPEPEASAMSQIRRDEDDPVYQERLKSIKKAIADKESALYLIPDLVPFDLGVDKLISLMDQDNIAISYLLLSDDLENQYLSDGNEVRAIVFSKAAFAGNKTKLLLKLTSMNRADIQVTRKGSNDPNGDHEELMTYEIDAENHPLMFKVRLGLRFPHYAWVAKKGDAEEV